MKPVVAQSPTVYAGPYRMVDASIRSNRIATENGIVHVRKGMAAYTTDGQTLGKVEWVWFGTDPTARDLRCDDEVCSRLEVHHGLFLRRTAVYVPVSAIADLADGHVMLNVDAATVNEHDWVKRPAWIVAVAGGGAEPLDDTGSAAYRADVGNG